MNAEAVGGVGKGQLRVERLEKWFLKLLWAIEMMLE
jgi:hypothetical protein